MLTSGHRYQQISLKNFGQGGTMTTGNPKDYVTPEVKANIGKEGPAFTLPELLDRSTLRRFAQATQDRNPLYSDEEAARKSRYGGLIVPPAHLAPGAGPAGPRELAIRSGAMPQVEIPGMSRAVFGGNEIEYFRPVYLGDALTSRTRITYIQQRQGRSGPMVITAYETVYTNQRNDLVAISHQTRIRLP